MQQRIAFIIIAAIALTLLQFLPVAKTPALANRISTVSTMVAQNASNNAQESDYKAVQIQANAHRHRRIMLVHKAFKWALRHRGHPYIWGGIGPYGYDCSGFVYADYYLFLHHYIGRTVADMVASGKLIPESESSAKRGDLVVFNYTQHVEEYAGSPFLNHHWHHFYTLGAAHSGTVTAIHNQDYKWWYHIAFYKVRGSRGMVNVLS